jgi:hypothetical protein
MVFAHMVPVLFGVVIHERAAHRVIRPTVHVAAVGAFAVGLLVQLECGVRTNVFDVFCGIGKNKSFSYPLMLEKLILTISFGFEAARIVGVAVAVAVLHANGQILLFAVLLVLDVGD